MKPSVPNLPEPSFGNSLLPFLRQIVHAYAWRIRHWDLSIEKAAALVHIHVHPGESGPAQVAEACCVPRQTMTSLLDSLERDGLARRTPHPTDRRKKIMVITAKGTRLARTVMRDLLDCEHAAMNVIEPELLPKIRGLLEKYTAELTKVNQLQPPSVGGSGIAPYRAATIKVQP